MQTATSTAISDELSALRQSFWELLLVRKSIELSRERVRRFRSADRRLRKAHSAIQRQFQSLAADLHAMGVAPMELLRIMEDAAEAGASRFADQPTR